MPHAVVERFEIVDVEEEDADAFARQARAFEGCIQRDEQLPAVGDAGERVLLRELLQLARPLLHFGFKTLLRIARCRACRSELFGH